MHGLFWHWCKGFYANTLLDVEHGGACWASAPWGVELVTERSLVSRLIVFSLGISCQIGSLDVMFYGDALTRVRNLSNKHTIYSCFEHRMLRFFLGKGDHFNYLFVDPPVI